MTWKYGRQFRDKNEIMESKDDSKWEKRVASWFLVEWTYTLNFTFWLKNLILWSCRIQLDCNSQTMLKIIKKNEATWHWCEPILSFPASTSPMTFLIQHWFLCQHSSKLIPKILSEIWIIIQWQTDWQTDSNAYDPTVHPLWDFISALVPLPTLFQTHTYNTFRDMNYYPVTDWLTDRQKAMHMSPLCNMHGWAQKPWKLTRLGSIK